nr:hypothetical protein LTR18_002313 [Exophiala xenobiotica]
MQSSARWLKLIGKKIKLSEALTDEDDVLQMLRYPKRRIELIVLLLENENEILHIAAQHLNVKANACELSQVSDWIHGSFNLCIPIHVNWNGHKRVLFRVPLPYKIGEEFFPGNVDEKIRCEAATYIYIRQCCPEVPIPMLLGFGLSTGISVSLVSLNNPSQIKSKTKQFTSLENTSFLCRLRRWLSNRLRTFARYPLPSPFVPDNRMSALRTGYLLLQYIEDGQMLSETFDSQIRDPTRQHNLFRDLSRIMVSLAKIPQPRIGSFTIDNTGFISLSNRPLTLRLQALENEGISTNIHRLRTYECTDSYALDLLAYHDSRLLCQPNSMNDEMDGRRQMSAIGLMRSVMPQFINSKTKCGPFFVGLTDLHPSNIFVNEHWQVTSLIDLEWACSHPVEMLRPPYWLTGQNLDRLDGANFEKFSSIREEFMAEFQQQERLITSEVGRSAIMEENWKVGSFWFFHALESTKGLYNIFKQHIMPRFSRDADFPDISQYWGNDTSKIICSKLQERRGYLQQLTLAALTTDSDSDSDTCNSS